MPSCAFRLHSANGRLAVRTARGVRSHTSIRLPGSLQKRRVAEEHKTDAQLTTEKYGLEAGLVKVLTEKKPAASDAPSRTEQAKQLLKQYGSAYLITSISFAIVSFSACYALVSAGVDVAALLNNLGLSIQSGSTSEAVGTFAIAYAAHKALSPVRFPPTVALTPVVAKWLKRDGNGGSTDSSSSQE